MYRFLGVNLSLFLLLFLLVLISLGHGHVGAATVPAGLLRPATPSKFDHIPTRRTLPTVWQLTGFTHTTASALGGRVRLVCYLVLEKLFKDTAHQRSGGSLWSQGVKREGGFKPLLKAQIGECTLYHGVFWRLLFLSGSHSCCPPLPQCDPGQFDECPHAGSD